MSTIDSFERSRELHAQVTAELATRGAEMTDDERFSAIDEQINYEKEIKAGQRIVEACQPVVEAAPKPEQLLDIGSFNFVGNAVAKVRSFFK